MPRLALVSLWILALAACGGPPARRAPEPAGTPRLAERARAVHAAFDPERAHATVAFVERHFRVRGNEGYVKTLDRVRAELRAAGLERVRVLELGPVRPAWTPRSASLALAGEEPLVAFAAEHERDRAALLVRSDDLAPTELELVRIEAVRAGESARGRAVLAEGEPRDVFDEVVVGQGAAGILVRNLEPYHQPARFPDAAQFGYLPEHEGAAFGFSLSERAWARLRAATESGPARVRVAVDVALRSSAATAVEARIEGTDPSAGAVVFVAHADEPGANDNASGVAALAELAGALHRLTRERPLRRTLVFLWGQEIEVSQEWLADPPLPVAAGLVLDMVGQDPAVVGAPFLIERMPDPGAVWLRDPDAHSEWGASEVDPSSLRGHFLNDLIAASAREVERVDGPWQWRSHPFEGGSDHVPFLRSGLPAVLAWHFTDSAYHTTLDRLDRVSGAEMRRVAAVMGAAALSLASGDEGDAEELVTIVEGGWRDRSASLARASSALIERGASTPAAEARVRRAWIEWYDEALASIAAWAPASEERATRARAALRGPTPR